MAVTPRLNLYKPVGSDYVSVDRDLNENYDKIDSAVGTNYDKIVDTRKDIAIVEDTDTATHNITRDSLVIWKGELYVVKSTISIGDTLSSSNLGAISNGLQSRIPTVASRTLAGNDDFNNLPNFGLYPFSVGSTNQPPIIWGMLLNLPYAGNAVYQLAWNRHDIYYRDYTGTPSSWSAWKKAGKDENDKITNMLTTESGTVTGTYGSTYYYRMGNICYITSSGNFASSAFTSYAVGTLPAKCKPRAGQTIYGMTIADNDSNSTGLLVVNGNGNVTIQSRGSWWYQQNVRGDVTFPCVGDI